MTRRGEWKAVGGEGLVEAAGRNTSRIQAIGAIQAKVGSFEVRMSMGGKQKARWREEGTMRQERERGCDKTGRGKASQI